MGVGSKVCSTPGVIVGRCVGKGPAGGNVVMLCPQAIVRILVWLGDSL